MDAGINLCLHPAPEGFDPWIAVGAPLRGAHAHALLKQYPLQRPVAGAGAILIAAQYRSLKVRYLKIFSQVIRSPARVLKTFMAIPPFGGDFSGDIMKKCTSRGKWLQTCCDTTA